ncbi:MULTISPECIES: aldo/keto reductase [Loigolactobacillus]|uniref:NADP-dependent oxidoreductase domain-containing protein n=1 Tax=Loigolactobacillus backii TaxID=375175 RepID=A0A192H2H8_9LACO|nr:MULTISPECIES: aldo/keto reductase [Loigolactobacillus]ANK59105.1 hypothetical protein AYR52_01775 [Loigolactobacillus backii]ANK62483.1 hypothetical protein AYR53_06710 [Loigolactobacillus backii]ANK64094.1 hypothetical protein AYR54_01765 [Loigolactobacillus backii]ANK67512.1 hypothetical protein AYR55_07275 [Loigolactobacillus backii]ANK70505.1 hypothetical protein AYR56_10280 [Loigolactobacillus backii]
MRYLDFKGERLPVIGMGTWHMGDDPNKRGGEIQALRYGLEHGSNLIDTAEMYGDGRSEELVGAAIKPYTREKLFLVSKFYPQNASIKRMKQSLTASLKRLQTDYLDLYLLHWRGQVPLKETITGLRQLQQAGKIRHWGVSNFDTADMLELFQETNGADVFANEDLYNLADRGVEYDLLPWQLKNGVPFIAYSPIAQGDSRGQQLTANPVIQKIAKAHQITSMQLLLAWTIRQPQLLAIPQTSQWKHMQANLAAADVTLTPAEIVQIDAAFPAPTKKRPLAII